MRINKTANDKKKIHLRIEEKEKKVFFRVYYSQLTDVNKK
jgi:hypothetical protein